MCHFSTDQSAFVGAVGPSTTYQETQEKSHPLMSWVISIQTPVLAVGPAVVCKPAVAPSLQKIVFRSQTAAWKPLENNLLHNYSQMRKTWWKSRLSRRSSNTLLEQKQIGLDTLEWVRCAAWLLPRLPSPKEHSSGSRKVFLSLWFMLWWKERAMHTINCESHKILHSFK